jgi:hypothetical protein
MNGMEILQMDRENADLNLKRRFYRMALKLVVHRDVDVDSLLSGRLWTVLVKKSFNLQVEIAGDTIKCQKIQK